MVTALHVIQSAVDEFPLGFSLSTGYGRKPFVVSGPIHFEPMADLAVYFFPEDYPHDVEGIAFWPEDHIQRSTERISTDYLFVHGFPQARSKFLSLFQGVASRSLPYGVMQRLEGLPQDLQPFQFAVDFDPANMHLPQGGIAEFIDPHGLSGSPVWRIGISGRSAADWKPELSRVIGFVTQWRPTERLLLTSSASMVPELETHL